MITAQVFQEMTVQQLNAVAQACGFATHIDDEGELWVQVAGQVTAVGLSKDRGRVLFIKVAPNPATAAQVSSFVRETGSWCASYITDKGHPTIARWFFARGATREHVAEELFVWETYVSEFFKRFGRQST